MTLWTSIWHELSERYTGWLVVAVLASAMFVVRSRNAEHRRRFRAIFLLFVLHLLAGAVAGVVRLRVPEAYPIVAFICVVLAAAAFVGAAILLVFGAALPRLGFNVPPILRDVAGGGLLFTSVLVLAGQAGINATGIVATSAVVTAVIGLSLQDTLGNLLAGLALQTDHSIRVGDWIKLGEFAGRVDALRWRYTSIETRNAELVVIPNSQLVRGIVVVLGRSDGGPLHWRRTVLFNVDFRFAPALVIRTVMDALRVAEIPRMTKTPPPDCILREFQSSYAQYAVRYHLLDFSADDSTDSDVRACIWAALSRRQIPMSIPAEARFVTEESKERQESKLEAMIQHRATVLKRIDLFCDLSDEDRLDLARNMHAAAFVRGEVLTRQGTDAHYLYLIESGRASVRVASEYGERVIAELGSGEIFGEISLMTGARRSASVQALEDVMAYRLDKEAFHDMLHRRPKLAELFAEVLAKRKLALDAAKDELKSESERASLAATKSDLLTKIRRFFALEGEEPNRPS